MSKTAMTGVNMFLKYLLLPIICMIGLAIAYKPLSEYTYGLTGWSKFIMELIFYIPCLILDFFEYLKEWIHYIPVKRDLSDLVEKTTWCLTNYTKALQIAENAYAFSKTYLTRDACYKKWNDVINHL